MGMMELEEYSLKRNNEYLMRVLNKRYWPHQITCVDFMAAEKWCYEHFKSAHWRNVGRTFAFKHGQDATMFSLKWQ